MDGALPRAASVLDGALPRVGTALAVLVAVALVVLPVGAMVARSFRVDEVVTTDGDVLVAVGDVRVRPGVVQLELQDAPGGERRTVDLESAKVVEVRRAASLRHYEHVLGDPRVHALMRNSLLLATLAVLASLVLGLPLAWILSRTDLPGRRVLFALDLAAAVLPPFVAALGAARPLGTALADVLGLTGATLQTVNGALLFGFVLHPLVVLLVGRALAAVPAGPCEAARLLRGPAAATWSVVLPAVRPAVLGASVLVFVVALTEFGVPDLLSFILPPGGAGVHVFAREIQVQWATEGNHARAVATGAPLALVTVPLVLLAATWLRRSPAASLHPGRTRARVRLGPVGRLGSGLAVLAVLGLALGLPLGGILSWGLGHGETVATGSGGGAAAGPGPGRLFDFATTFRNTPGLGEMWGRWLLAGTGAALLATLVSVGLARLAVRGGRLARAFVLTVGVLPLAVPGLVFGVGTALLATHEVPWLGSMGDRAVAALTGRVLPYALLAAWLALREVPPGLEEAGRVQGAGPTVRAVRLWGPLAGRGILAGTLLALLVALREVDAIVLLQTGVFPLRLYDKIHYSRLADEANLALLYVGHLAVPALGVAALGARRRRTGDGGRS